MIALAPWQVKEIAKCALDPVYFAETFAWIQQKASAGVSEKTSIIPFEMGLRPPTMEEIRSRNVPDEAQFYFQRQIIEDLFAHKNVLTLKSRRVGCSWAAAIYVAWLINFHENVSVAFISRNGASAKQILAKVKFILKNLAYHDHATLRKATKADFLKGDFYADNQERLSIAWRNENGDVTVVSEVISLNNTDDSGRGDDYSFIVFDELDFYEHPDQTWSSAITTMARGGHWMAISTPNQIGYQFHRMCARGDLAEAGKLDEDLGYKYLKIHWSEAGITADQIRKSTVGMTQELADQEWEWKFITPGTVAFDPTHLAVCYKPPDQFPDVKQALEEYHYRVQNAALFPKELPVYYYTGVDSAKGNPSKKSREKDYHSFIAMTKSGIQAFAYHSQEPLSAWAGNKVSDGRGGYIVVAGTASKLHADFPGLCQIEEDGPGYTTVSQHQVPEDNISTMQPVSMRHKFKKGIIERLIIKVETHQIVITDLFTYQCMMTFQKGSTPGTYEAAQGYNDDPVMAIALAEDGRDQEGGMEFPWGYTSASPGRSDTPYFTENLPAGPQVSLAIPAANARLVDAFGFDELPAMDPFHLRPDDVY